MKRKHFCIVVSIILGTACLWAGEPETQADRITFAIHGAPVLNVYENAFSYKDNGRLAGLFTLQGGVALGYEFSDTFGMRLDTSFGGNAGACNTRQTSGGGFFPYNFKSVNFFADAILNLNGLAGRITAFRPKVYGGLGGAHTFSFSDPAHPWQKVNTSNTVFGLRLGVIAELNFNQYFGIYADLAGEAYNDMYNGLMPSAEDQTHYEGYAGFPLDLRGSLSFGLVFHF